MANYLAPEDDSVNYLPARVNPNLAAQGRRYNLTERQKINPLMQAGAEQWVKEFASMKNRGAVPDLINRGLIANTAGLPVDLVNTVLQSLGLGSEQPVGGSDSIRRALEYYGLSSETQRPMLETLASLTPPRAVMGAARVAGQGAEAVGRAAAPVAGQAIENYMVRTGGILPALPPSLIKDWRWRPLKDVSADLNIKEVPKYIQEGYGAFMAEQAKRAAAGDLGARDLIKAYGITRSSVNRAGRQMSDDLASGFTRPEGYMSEWFSSPAGKSYLDAAQSGKVDSAAIDDLVGRFQPFGMSQVLGKDLEYAAQKLPQINGSINDLVQGSVPEWRKFAQGIYGIGPAKSGFLPSMLGRGDIPTLDARQLNLHTLDSGDSASKFMRRQGGAGGDQAVDRLASRQQKMNLEISPELQPFYQHLTHHAVWDKIGNSITTHSDIVKAMLTAGIAPIAIPGLVEIVMREKGID